MLSWDTMPVLSPMRCSRAWVEINLSALAHNVRSLKSLLPAGTDLMTVVKADAYGHGAITVARVALTSGATWLGVATVPEGIELREAGITAPILVMGAVNDPEEIRAIARWTLQPTLVNPKQALIFSETLAELAKKEFSQDRPNAQADVPRSDALLLPVHLKLDTGMSRLGFSWERAVEFVQFVQQLSHLKTVSVYSHLATADSTDLTVMRKQQDRFECAIADLKKVNLLPSRLHLANSAATLVSVAQSAASHPSPLTYDMVRVGLATYGLYPAPHLRSVINLRPVLEVKARITHIKQIAPGDGVSYGHNFVASRPMTIAIVGIGYADGIPRRLSNQLQVSVHHQCVSQIGAITMDQLMLDVSTIQGIKEGDIVTLLGEETAGDTSKKYDESNDAGQKRDIKQSLSADRWAELTDTIAWEILCGFKHRMPRIETHNAPSDFLQPVTISNPANH